MTTLPKKRRFRRGADRRRAWKICVRPEKKRVCIGRIHNELEHRSTPVAPVQPPVQQPEATPESEPEITTFKRISPPAPRHRKRSKKQDDAKSKKKHADTRWIQTLPQGIALFMQQDTSRKLTRLITGLEKEVVSIVGRGGMDQDRLEVIKTASKEVLKYSQKFNTFVTELWGDVYEVGSAAQAATSSQPEQMQTQTQTQKNVMRHATLLGGSLRRIREETAEASDLLKQVIGDNEGGVSQAGQFWINVDHNADQYLVE
ncbi:hypothetical protein F4818DRAFT_111952 [Hypoxylon cercidicola]|nr:hypothetical protein F4818DRAFT_111952 [Hypoxylon cercidicola]